MSENINGQEVTGARPGKYLTFTLDGELYGVEIKKVREINGMMPITRVPKTPDYVKGVINLRGMVIPVMELRKKFGMPSAETTKETCIIVLEITKDGASVNSGIIVDSVSDVVDIAQNELENTPSFGSGIRTDYILGMAKSKSGVSILLDIDKALAG